MGISASEYYDFCNTFSIYWTIMINFFSALLAAISIEIMRRIQGWNNLSLLLLLLCIFIGSVMIGLCAYWILTSFKIKGIPISIGYLFLNSSHWIIAKIYIQASFETRMLLNKDTYTKSANELV